MEIAINEVKTQAKKLLKAFKTDHTLQQKMALQFKKNHLETISKVQLKHCFTLISQQLGFIDWHHAQRVLSGNAQLENQPDMGTTFYKSACGGLLNQWFSDYEQAKAALAMQPSTSWLIPYQKQFIVVTRDYLKALNINEDYEKCLQTIGHDLFAGYNTQAWDNLAYIVIRNRTLITGKAQG
jgi:hypothetical protein